MRQTSWHDIAVLTQYTVREALKNRVFWIAVVFGLVGVGVAAFIGDVAIIEHEKVETAILAGAFRFCAVLVMMILVVSTMVREFNDKCLELFLSLPISRVIYFVGKLAGFFIAGVGTAGVFSAILFFYAEPSSVFLWWFSLSCELAIVSTVSFFCVMTFNQQIPASFAAALFFYLMCRVGDAVLLISNSDIVLNTPGRVYIGYMIDTLVTVLPNLARFTRTEWVSYGAGGLSDVPLIAAQSVLYVLLIGAAAMFDFSRKNL